MYRLVDKAPEMTLEIIGLAIDVLFGLIINFHEQELVDGVSRSILPGSNLE